ncbi:Signal transduction response regulator, receiver domain histidine kinase [Desulfonema limicola]|uniref:histidine kinase n=1 Tax=Desulfonema limicola TaxID=45656 RepID=A0A975B737_9BACT|nr:ATP-binding protein [Desulfonema limicola]QTA79907.1 Signal transduction response regulator, receiver domain histidine kinase [Desulfonema limicola]
MNKRIIVIDDEESIIKDYMLILLPEQKALASLEKKAAALEAELFGNPFPAKESIPESYELTTALQGEEGFKKVEKAIQEEKPFALAFIDIRMPPGWDGLETAQKIRQIDKNIEIVIVTAYSDKERMEIVKKVGSPQKLLYLKKPFDPDEIRQFALALTRKWNLEFRAERHRIYLEQLLTSVRRLKTLSISSLRGVLSAILNEVLSFIGAHKGFIARLDKENVNVEIISSELSFNEIEIFKQKISNQLTGIKAISWIEEIMVVPLKDMAGNLFILVLDSHKSVCSEKLKLLTLLLETSSEVFESVKKQEQYLKNEKIATIGQIAAGMIHEINNPLSAIVGAAELNRLSSDKMWQFFDTYKTIFDNLKIPDLVNAQMEALNEQTRPDILRQKMKKHHDIIRNGVEQVRSLMGNIRNFSKVKDNFKPVICDVSEALESTLMLAHNSIKYGIIVHKQWSSPLIARCDISGLKQVFLNLILNAVQAMKGTGELWITGEKKHGSICISIKDTGPGIPEEDLERIFTAFYTTKDTGTGLGLSIVNGIINKHNGTIKVESKPGQGTTFYLDIPAV